jgi:hypothetical protein
MQLHHHAAQPKMQVAETNSQNASVSSLHYDQQPSQPPTAALPTNTTKRGRNLTAPSPRLLVTHPAVHRRAVKQLLA